MKNQNGLSGRPGKNGRRGISTILNPQYILGLVILSWYSRMRKRTKLKLRSCAMCKPHKMGWENRWKVKQRDALKRAEKEIRQYAP